MNMNICITKPIGQWSCNVNLEKKLPSFCILRADDDSDEGTPTFKNHVKAIFRKSRVETISET